MEDRKDSRLIQVGLLLLVVATLIATAIGYLDSRGHHEFSLILLGISVGALLVGGAQWLAGHNTRDIFEGIADLFHETSSAMKKSVDIGNKEADIRKMSARTETKLDDKLVDLIFGAVKQRDKIVEDARRENQNNTLPGWMQMDGDLGQHSQQNGIDPGHRDQDGGGAVIFD